MSDKNKMVGIREGVFALVTILTTYVSRANADAICGQYLCTGWTSHCCSFNQNECCYYQFYSFWWFWFMWVLIFLMCASCGYLCRRRYVQRREVIVVRGDPQQIYGAVGPQVNQGYVEQPVGYNFHGGQQKPPEYTSQPVKPPPYTAVP